MHGYVLVDGQLAIDEKSAAVVCLIFEYYLAGASRGKVADMLLVKEVPSPTGNYKWTRAAIDKMLSNRRYIPIVGFETYADAQF